MEDPLSSDKLKAIAQSVLLRCEYLATMFGSDAPMTARTGLVTLNRTIYLLATRYLGDPVEPFVLSADIRANRTLVWYQHYLKALINVSQVVQSAIDEGQLTPRCLVSRVPFPRETLTDWTTRDIADAVSSAARTFWESPPAGGTDSPAWPDHAARAPGVGIDQRELSDWGAKVGLELSPRNDANGELAGLVANTLVIDVEPEALAADSSNTLPTAVDALSAADPAESTNSQTGDWCEEARRIADELHLRDRTNGTYDSLTHLAERVAEEMRSRDINGPRGPLIASTIRREALQGGKWKRPKPK
ncbi:Uncharacterised protein [Burkholderia pseudomallei]|nr:Uncharacterised protein [Burkholderia pseudomallei]